MPLPFRQRIFVILVALSAVPTVLAVVGWALAVRTVAPSAGARVALEEMAASARLMVDRMDTTHLSARERVPRSGAPGSARDQESAHGHADRSRPTAAVRGSGGPADGHGSGSHGRGDRTAAPAREGVLRVRAPPRGAEERGGSRGPPD